ncbi:hypothetical protein F4553_005385 [Allocatelliglobosispora scoriae]|uniref:DNA primase/polymerase bifunctional N-terminal domain-containing protein n=1 Tax=Allocatelliglobosispora scoriae TaxID=643052 RepID=A0A841BWW5_9ACTN|nr:bifunctional DNA primase/polymerase [Allocatelliglobosispora scoriae]MBB5872006.1 hypothetical protein [Allocatelliglobosispora scoriae]
MTPALTGLLARGLALFPMPAGQRQAPPGWQHRASRDPHQPWPHGSNVGIGCRASGIVVLDLDRKNGHDGIAVFGQLCAGAGQAWPDTFTVTTPHGLHLYFTAPAGPPIASTIWHTGPGIDVRAPGWSSGGYVIGPGSTVNNRPYVITHDRPLLPLPTWLMPHLRVATPPRR